MGGGGLSGSVTYPAYIQDWHGMLIGGSEVDTAGGGVWLGSESYPDKNLAQILIAAWSADPWNYTYGAVSTAFASSNPFMSAYSDAVSSYYAEVFTSLVSTAVAAVSSPGIYVADLVAPSITTPALTVSFATSAERQIRDDFFPAAVSSAVSYLATTAATTEWKSFATDLLTFLNEQRVLPCKEAVDTLREVRDEVEATMLTALTVAKDMVSSSAIDDLVDEFDARNSTSRLRNVAQFSAQMADGNAIQSSAYMFGLALMYSEQQRETAEFNKELTYSMLKDMVLAFIDTHKSDFAVAEQSKNIRAQLKKDILVASVTQMLSNRDRDLDKHKALLAVYADVFKAYINDNIQRGVFQLEADKTAGTWTVDGRARGGDWELQAASFNSQTQRFQRLRIETNTQLAMQLLGNKAEFKRMLASLYADYDRVKYQAKFETEKSQLEANVRSDFWELQIASEGARIMAAPAGMGAAVPDKPSAIGSAVGALAGAGIGALMGPGGAAIGAGLGQQIGANI